MHARAAIVSASAFARGTESPEPIVPSARVVDENAHARCAREAKRTACDASNAARARVLARARVGNVDAASPRGAARAPLSPLRDDATPLRRARSLMAEAATTPSAVDGVEPRASSRGRRARSAGARDAEKDADALEDEAPRRAASDAASVASASALDAANAIAKYADRERQLVAFMKEMASNADARLNDALDALRASETQREEELAAMALAADAERETLEYSILLENKARVKERERVVELETLLAMKEREIEALAAERRVAAPPSAAAVRYAASVRDEVRAILRAEFKRELADELLK